VSTPPKTNRHAAIGAGRPSPERLQRFLDSLLPELTYSYVASSRDWDPPYGWDVDTKRVQIGTTDQWDQARQALRDWAMFDQADVLVFPAAPELKPDVQLVVAARFAGLWVLNGLRIVYVIDQPDRFGFGYGTLQRHAECGEERFLVERDQDGVWFDLRAFSRPRHPGARALKPLVRKRQAQFGRAAAEVMRLTLSGYPRPR
jgi:uncharacterized protein (UPF0548 family)